MNSEPKFVSLYCFGCKKSHYVGSDPKDQSIYEQQFCDDCFWDKVSKNELGLDLNQAYLIIKEWFK